jgi:hypothetical protein
VINHVGSHHEASNRGFVAQVAGDYTRSDCLDLSGPGRRPGQHLDVGPLGQETPDEGATNKTGGAGYADAHGRWALMFEMIFMNGARLANGNFTRIGRDSEESFRVAQSVGE